MSSYIDSRRQENPSGEPCMSFYPAHSWGEFTRRRLDWLYGLERSALIATGRDLKTQEDIARWNSMGRRDAA